MLAPDRRQILVQVEVPPLGWATVENGRGGSRLGNLPSAAGPGVLANDRFMSNGLVSVSAAEDGTVRLWASVPS